MGSLTLLYDMSKKEGITLSIKKTQCLYLERYPRLASLYLNIDKFEHLHPYRYFCRLKGLWINLSDCDKCNVGILKSGDGKILVGQKRLTNFLKPKSNYDISKRPLSEKGLSKHN
jgi:hypothetical protein